MKTSLHQILTLSLVFLLTSFNAFSQAIYRPYSPHPIAAPTLRDVPEKIDRRWDVRVGPRMGLIQNGKIRPGRDGSSQLDFDKDLGLDQLGTGIQFDLEMKVSPSWIARVNYSSTSYNADKVTTSQTLLYQNPTPGASTATTQSNPAVLPAGSTIDTQIDIDTFSGQIEYALYSNQYFTFDPVLGFKSVFYTQKISIFNSGTGGTVTDDTDIVDITPIFGFDSRLQIDKNTYVGIAPHGFVWDKFYYIGGQAYLGFDFEKFSWGALGVRLGLDADLVEVRDVGGDSPNYNVRAAQLAPFIQVVYGF